MKKELVQNKKAPISFNNELNLLKFLKKQTSLKNDLINHLIKDFSFMYKNKFVKFISDFISNGS